MQTLCRIDASQTQPASFKKKTNPDCNTAHSQGTVTLRITARTQKQNSERLIQRRPRGAPVCRHKFSILLPRNSCFLPYVCKPPLQLPGVGCFRWRIALPIVLIPQVSPSHLHNACGGLLNKAPSVKPRKLCERQQVLPSKLLRQSKTTALNESRILNDFHQMPEASSPPPPSPPRDVQSDIKQRGHTRQRQTTPEENCKLQSSPALQLCDLARRGEALNSTHGFANGICEMQIHAVQTAHARRI